MPPKTSAAPKKTLYHSELLAMGPVNVTVKSDVLNSKYQGKPPYVVLEIDGADRNYTLDSQACVDFFEGHKGETFAIEAVGGKGQEDINYMGDENAPAQPKPAPAQRPAPQPRSAPAPGRTPPPTRQAPPAGHAPAPAGNGSRPPAHAKPTPEQAIGKVKVLAAKAATLEKICHLATQQFAAEWLARFGTAMPGEQYLSSNSRIYMEIKGRIQLDDLPVSFDFATYGMAVPPPAPKPGHQPPPAPEPEAEPEAPPVEDDDVPF